MDSQDQVEIIVNLRSDYYTKMFFVSFAGSAVAYLLVTTGIGYLARKEKQKKKDVNDV